jgi:hypothetical protein
MLLEREAKREIYAAKKILYEGDNKTRNSFISLLLGLVSLHLLTSPSFCF